MTKMLVSGSEVANPCERRALYAHHPGYNLEPKSLGPSLTRGLIGHKALEIFYQGILDGENREAMKKQVIDRLMVKSMRYMTEEGDIKNSEMVANLASRLVEYIDFFNSELDNFDIIAVEMLLKAPLPSPVAEFVGRVDLVVKYKQGEWKGEIIPIDHKFVYNFWPDAALQVNAQLPNYITALRHMMPDAFIKRALVNQIRWRPDAVERFKREPIIPTRLEASTLFKNHSDAATRWVTSVKSLPIEEARAVALRNPSKFNCQYCPFVRLCKAELIGEDTTNIINFEFQPNSYGYADRDDEQ